MGLVKRVLMEQQERGYRHIGDKYVCPHCFDDYAIKEFIRANAEEKKCFYCARRSKEKFAAHLEKVVELIVQGISTEWQDPNNAGVPWEGGWALGKVIDTYELIYDEQVIPTENDKLLEDIFESMDDQQWCEKPFWELSEDKKLLFGWKQFAEEVKHGVRYLFLKTEPKEEYKDPDSMEPTEMLEALERIITDIDLVKVLKAGAIVYRARKWDKTFPLSAEELGCPSKEQAIYSNRMSPAGIPMFYGSLDRKTAIAEISDRGSVAVGKFKSLKDIRVIDLSKIPSVPSMYDVDSQHIRAPIAFLHDFVREVSKPISKDGREHIEYVPTQIVTEYFRHIYKYLGDKVVGILYPSSKSPKGVSCVFFINKEQCCSQGEDQTQKLIIFESAFLRRMQR